MREKLIRLNTHHSSRMNASVFHRILQIVAMLVFCFSSKVAFAEQIENKPQCNDIVELKNAAKSLYDSKKKRKLMQQSWQKNI